MFETLMVTITITAVISYVYLLYKKRKNLHNGYGWKSYVTPSVFMMAPLAALVSYLFNFGGIVTWLVLGMLFFTGAYFTKYLPQPEES